VVGIANAVGNDVRIDIPSLLNRPLREVQQLLEGNTTDSQRLRLGAPLEIVVPRAKRESIMRSVAGPITVFGVTMAERWASNDSPRGWVDSLAEQTISALEHVRDQFTRFVRASLCFRWLLTADFTTGAQTKVNDVFAFTLYPLKGELAAMMDEAQTVLPRDYKRTKRSVEPEGLGYLASTERFTFAFVPTRSRTVIPDIGTARDGIVNTMDMMRNRHDADRNPEELKIWDALRQEASSNSFHFRRFENMVLVAAFAGVVLTLLAGEGRATSVGFIPDRDAMFDAYNRIGIRMVTENASMFSLRYRFPPMNIFSAVAEDVEPGDSAWFDPLIRVPDYIAGVVAGVCFGGGTEFTRPDRDMPLLQHVLADNPNVVVLHYPELTPNSIKAAHMIFSAMPPPIT
jgi:hypothetical protein